MNETDIAKLTLGEYLRRLRESRNLSQREAAKRAGISYAYLSQIEGSKRGKRKEGAENFAPHPQFLKKLADIYHVSAGHLFVRAGFIEGDKTNLFGFSEKNETDRVFDFVIHDPALKQIFSVLEKRAIIGRYEALTGKRLITWAGEPDSHPTVTKTEFAGLRSENGVLHADTSKTKLSVKEVAAELECSEDQVRQFIKNNQIIAEENDFKELFVETNELQKFKIKAIRNWMHTGARIPIAKPSSTWEEQEQQLEAMEGAYDENGGFHVDDHCAIPENTVAPNKPRPQKSKSKK